MKNILRPSSSAQYYVVRRPHDPDPTSRWDAALHMSGLAVVADALDWPFVTVDISRAQIGSGSIILKLKLDPSGAPSGIPGSCVGPFHDQVVLFRAGRAAERLMGSRKRRLLTNAVLEAEAFRILGALYPSRRAQNAALKFCYAHAMELVEENRIQVATVAWALLEREELFENEVRNIIDENLCNDAQARFGSVGRSSGAAMTGAGGREYDPSTGLGPRDFLECLGFEACIAGHTSRYSRELSSYTVGRSMGLRPHDARTGAMGANG